MIKKLIFAATFISAGVLADDCKITETTITGNSMQGLLWDGQKISVKSMGCGAPKRFDHMVFTHPETPNAVVKQIWGLPGESISVTEKGHLFVGDLRVLTPFGKPYKLLGFSKKRLSRLSGAPLEGYLVLGHPGSLDSARLGLVVGDAILGYVEGSPVKQVPSE